MNPLNVVHLGTIGYHAAWDLQRELVKKRTANEVEDTLLILEHPHTYTLGRAGNMSNLLLSEAELREQGITFVPIDRGGDITYHGPGQLVAYPILNLMEQRTGVGRLKADFIAYIRDIEEVIIRLLATYNIEGFREPGLTGVWVTQGDTIAKIAAIGIKINTKGVTMHGVALNVTTDLTYYAGIVPCGIDDKPVTSMQAILADAVPPMEEVIQRFEAAFAEVFERDHKLAPLSSILTSERT